jgi:hypothetical protein
LGASGSFDDFKRELQKSVDIFVEWAKEDREEYPSIFDGEYSFEYKFNIESLLCCYNGILSRAALSRISGINEKQLGHYACGRSRPRQAQKVKIIEGLHRLGNELLAVTV